MRPILLTILAATTLWAHDLSLQTTLAAPAVVTRAVYGESEPATFIKIEIFSPQTPGEAYQTGATDRGGYFCFRPDQPGAWRVVADDELGHRQQTTIDIPDPFQASSAAAPAATPRWERALLGVALLVGLTGIWYGARARRTAGSSG